MKPAYQNFYPGPSRPGFFLSCEKADIGVSAGFEIFLKPTRFFSEATRVLVTTMEEAQVKRLICVTALAVRLAQRRRGPCRTVVMPRSSRNA